MSEAEAAQVDVGTLSRDVRIEAPVEDVWAAICDVYAVHERLVPGMVIATRRDDDVRTVTFANGAVASERILSIDDSRLRLEYSVIGNGLTFHRASMQAMSEGTGSKLIWSAEFLPREIAGHLEDVMTQGIALMKKTIEQAAA